jgi:hypothetical protein
MQKIVRTGLALAAGALLSVAQTQVLAQTFPASPSASCWAFPPAARWTSMPAC